MSTSFSGTVDRDGKSTVIPADIYDMVERAEAEPIDHELNERLDKLFADANSEIKAKYRLELFLSEKRSSLNPYGGFVSAWSNGGYAHGGGDETIYFCNAKTVRNGNEVTCGKPLSIQFISAGKAVCQHCKTMLKSQDLTGQVFARLHGQQWARLLTRMFYRLEGSADLVLCVMPGDLRQATAEERVKEHRGEVLDHVRLRRVRVVYPLDRIIKDTSAGADLERRIRAFLEA